MEARRAALGLTLALTAAACDEGAQLRAVAPEIAVEPEALEFGAVPLGATRRLRLELSNQGNAQLLVSDVAVSAPFDFGGLDPMGVTLPPGARLSLDVGFQPTTEDAVSGELVITSDDPELPRLAVPLRGSGAEGQLTVTPAALDFADTPVGGARSAEVVIENLGLDAVSGGLVLDGVSSPGFFTSGGAPLEGELVVPARGALRLELGYRPLDPGDHSGQLRFETCEGRCGVEVDLRATAIQPTVRLDPPVVDFGAVGLGERRVEPLAVINEGTDAVTVERLALRGGAAIELLSTQAPPVTLEPGERLGIDLAFSPTEALELSATLEVGLDDPAFPLAEAGITGRGEGPRFAVAPERLVFGVQTERSPSRRLVFGLNAGSSVVEVREVSIQGDPALALGPLPGLPLGLGSGETLPVEVVFTPARLGAATATVIFRTSDPQAPEVKVPVLAGLAERVCELSLRPGGIVNFGAVVPAFRRDRRIIVENAGTEACALLSGAFRAPVDPALSVLGPDPFPVTLAPTETLELDFRFAPLEERETKGVFSLRTDEPLFPVRNLSFVGTGAGYLDLFTRPRVVDFGEVGIDCPREERRVEIVNAGSGAVEISGLSLTSSTAELSLEGPGAPFEVPAGQARSFSVRYDPAAAGSDRGIGVVEVVDLAFPMVVPLLGEGTREPRARVRFEQPPREDVDVLFVIDDSCSMLDEQQAISRNFRSFIMQADLRQVDFRIGVTTTTVLGTAGPLVGPPLTRSTSNLDAAFAQQTAVGIRGSGIELGLEAALGAVRRAERGFSPNRDLFRRNANKVIVVVSDEDDQSLLSPLTYAAELERRYPGFTAAVVSGQRSGCVSPDGSALPAPRYEAFVNEVSGISASICADWGQTLSSIGAAAFGLQSRFALGRAADPSALLEVRIDGQVVPASRYRLTAGRDAVVVEPPPPEGSTIEVEFTPAC